MALVVGVDSSTQSTKVEARDIETGQVIAVGSAPHPVTGPPVSEQDPEAWWSALVEAMAQLGTCRDEVVSLSIAGQQHGLVLIDEGGNAVRPAKLWNDTSSAAQATEMVAELGSAAWAQGCGSLPVASFTVSKLAWMAVHEPESLAQTAKLMLPHDYLTWRLTGEHTTDRGDASGTGWFDPAMGRYRPELLAAAGVDPSTWLEKLPTMVQPDEPAGEAQPEAARALGLPAGTPVGAGTGDNMAGALGLGLRAGDLAVSLGTSGTVYAVSMTGTTDESGLVAGFADATGRYLPLVCTLNATKVTDTVAQWLGTDAAGLSELALAAPEFDGTVLVPYFDGERTPNLPDATGTFVGLRTTTTRESLARAAHDGVLCGLFAGIDSLVDSGVDVGGRLHLIGGGSRSAAYRQRCADLRGAPIVVPETDETVATGAAVQAALLIEGAAEGALDVSASASRIATRWNLGAGITVDPQADTSVLRSTYNSVSGT